MEPTKLLYMEDMQLLECEAFVESVEDRDGKAIVHLNQTVFYPQGGGQPFDNGTITNPNANFVVEQVRFADGLVQHIGRFELGRFMQGEEVACTVDKERRELNTKLHSAGHVVDMAVNELGYAWTPGKGFHFPEGPYVEYEGGLGDNTVEAVAEAITNKINEIIGRGIRTEIKFATKDEIAKLCRHVPDYLPEDKPSRVVMYGDFGIPCGGTHVAELKDIGQEVVRKIKIKGETIRVSYDIS